jgi:hypothetical protein
MKVPILIEGIPYYRFRVRFRLADGRRRSWIRWSPGWPWVREEFERELAARGIEPEDIRPRSATIEEEEMGP